jgi:hypothetical protein
MLYRFDFCRNEGTGLHTTKPLGYIGLHQYDLSFSFAVWTRGTNHMTLVIMGLVFAWDSSLITSCRISLPSRRLDQRIRRHSRSDIDYSARLWG